MPVEAVDRKRDFVLASKVSAAKRRMAAVAIAARARTLQHQVGVARDEVLVPMPDSDLVRHGGTLEKEAERDGRKHWRSMYCALTEEILGIRRSEGMAMIDWIPLEEIVSVNLEGKEPDMLHAAPQAKAKGPRRFWRGGGGRRRLPHQGDLRHPLRLPPSPPRPQEPSPPH